MPVLTKVISPFVNPGPEVKPPEVTLVTSPAEIVAVLVLSILFAVRIGEASARSSPRLVASVILVAASEFNFI